MSKCSSCKKDFIPSLKKMGYHFKHVIDVDLMTRSIKTHIKNKGKNTIFVTENLIKI